VCERAKDFELETVADASSESSVTLMSKAITFRKSADKIVGKNIKDTELILLKKRWIIQRDIGIIERRDSIYRVNRLLTLKENPEEIFTLIKDYENIKAGKISS
jgi:hypothetical protein